jgi:hypothetical protein
MVIITAVVKETEKEVAMVTVMETEKEIAMVMVMVLETVIMEIVPIKSSCKNYFGEK